jgi:hypothetical protein
MTRAARIVPVVGLVLLVANPLAAQNAAQTSKDPRAFAVLQQSVAAMGRSVPQDSTAAGTVEIVAGSKVDQGTIKILTRGITQSAEFIQLSDRQLGVIYSSGNADEFVGAEHKKLPLELAVTSQCVDFPAPLLGGALSDPETSLAYVGLEAVGQAQAYHLRLSKQFTSRPNLQHLSEFSIQDLWVDAASNLPLKIAYTRRASGGMAPRVPVEVFFSDYRNVGGVLYPFSIRKSLNGTPWTTIVIKQVQVNTGLADSDFVLQ